MPPRIAGCDFTIITASLTKLQWKDGTALGTLRRAARGFSVSYEATTADRAESKFFLDPRDGAVWLRDHPRHAVKRTVTAPAAEESIQPQESPKEEAPQPSRFAVLEID